MLKCSSGVVDAEGAGGGQRRWPPLLREGCGGRPEGAVSPQARRSSANPGAARPERSEGHAQKTNLESHSGIIASHAPFPKNLVFFVSPHET